ncbi:hypothetical protein [Oricola sp.]|uniref:hypothetical protein n=1 Tax=Oricola sp. TaxID=1979950 RepID=UPI0025E8460C|nr:hypothetical protein [Oricola sp.]MCI5075640.1 hypothetical protein [Oricola sp.]
MPYNDRVTSLSPAADTTVLDYDFELTREDGLTVIRIRDGARETLTNGVDYVFPSGLGDTDGGSIQLGVGSLESDQYLLVGYHPLTRLSDFLASRAFDTSKINADLDALTIIAQEQGRDIARSLKFEFGVGSAILPVPAPVAGLALVGNDDGDGYVNKDIGTPEKGAFGISMLATATKAAAQALLGGGAAGIAVFEAETQAAGRSALGAGTTGAALFTAANAAAAALIIGAIANVDTVYGAPGDGSASDVAAFEAANTAGGLIYAPKPATGRTFGSPVAMDNAALLVDPTQTWDQLTDGGELNMHRGHFTDTGDGANIWRFSDRVFIGEAASKWAGAAALSSPTRDAGTSWFASYDDGPAYLGIGANLLVTAEANTENGLKIAGAFAATAEAETSPAMALSAFVSNARTSSSSASWALYVEAFHLDGAGSWTYGMEMEVRNASADDIDPNPYDFSAGKGALGIWLAASGHTDYGPAAANPCAAALVIGRNGAAGSWNKGIVFTENGLEGTDGSSGSSTYASAIALARHQRIEWFDPTNDLVAASITSGITAYANRVDMEFRDHQILFRGANQIGALDIQATIGAANYLQVVSNVTTAAPYIAATGTDTDVDLRLRPKNAGLLRFGTHAAIGAETVTGYITIKDDAGTSRKLAVVS